MSALESSVTLEDVFAVVEGKRVPLAPELAGYLTLEVADGKWWWFTGLLAASIVMSSLFMIFLKHADSTFKR